MATPVSATSPLLCGGQFDLNTTDGKTCVSGQTAAGQTVAWSATLVYKGLSTAPQTSSSQDELAPLRNLPLHSVFGLPTALAISVLWLSILYEDRGSVIRPWSHSYSDLDISDQDTIRNKPCCIWNRIWTCVRLTYFYDIHTKFGLCHFLSSGLRSDSYLAVFKNGSFLFHIDDYVWTFSVKMIELVFSYH